jgi:protocatechuate 3,4-dioxygenase, alpha subunit
MPTPSQTVGPFFGFALPFEGDADAVRPGELEAMRIEGRLIDGAGQPVPDALLEFWEGDQFARCRTDAEGAFHCSVRKPAPGRAGDGRLHAPHMNVTVFARGLLRHLVTRVYFPDEQEANGADPVLDQVDRDRRSTLIARPGAGTLLFDVRLQGDGETVFFAL